MRIINTALFFIGWPAPGGRRHWRGQERDRLLRQVHRGRQTSQERARLEIFK